MNRLLILSVLVCSLFLFGCLEDEPRGTVFFDNATVSVEIADTPEERSVGLMHRTKMGPTSGMLFEFEKEARHSFWMKNTKIALDMIFVSKDFEIVDILPATPCLEDPCETYEPKEAALYVIEVNRGFAEAKGVKIGQTVSISYPENHVKE